MTAVGVPQARPRPSGPSPDRPDHGRPRRRPPTRGPEDVERKKRTRRLVILLVAAAGRAGRDRLLPAALGGLFGGNVTVPNVVGQRQQRPPRRCRTTTSRWAAPRSRRATHGQGPRPVHRPQGGRSVSKNSAVKLVVSDGPNIPGAVPTVTGEQLAPATQLICRRRPLLHRQVRDQQPAHRDGAEPESRRGTKVEANRSRCKLTVSGTQTSVTVPSVLGQSPASAGSILKGAGLNVGTQTSGCSNAVPRRAGVVADPGAERDVPAQHPVNLVVSSGSCVAVPGVVGQTERGPVGHHRRRPGRQHHLRHHVRQRRAAGQRRQPDPGRGHAGGQRQHGDHLGLPAERRPPRRPRPRPRRRPRRRP